MAGLLSDVAKTDVINVKIGGDIVNTIKGADALNPIVIGGDIHKSVEDNLTKIANTKFANFDPKSTSLLPLAAIKTEQENALLQKDSPLNLANNYIKNLHVLKR